MSQLPKIPSGGQLRGMGVLRDPTLNKGTAFTEAERDALGLRGLLPPRVSAQEHQEARVLTNYRGRHTDLEKYVNLSALHDRNETLFFRLLVDHLEEMMPIVYTPTVGLACQEFGHIFQRPRGIFVSIADRGRVEELLRNWPEREVSIIVVTDGERILGLGDLGANGMGIPVGKLSLYTACAGVAPRYCLPVMLDVGTSNRVLVEDPQYIGLPQPRVTGAAYDGLVDEFIAAACTVFPGVLIQFEDFANHNAFRLLEKYRDRICCFNDDIQGTAAVALAGILSALRVTGKALADQTLLFLGAGEAATGIADLAVSALMAAGLDESAARRHCWLVDSKGLVVRSRSDLAEHKRRYAHPHPPVPNLLAALEAIRPTALIGVSAVPGAFTETVLARMAQLNERPIVFALSNPTSHSECTADQAYRGSAGRALFASGSPFGPVSVNGRTFVPRQGNNSYIFPGVGLGAIVTRSARVTDEMFMAAAVSLAAQVSEADLDMGSLYPPIGEIRQVSARIAAAVADVAFSRGLAQVPRPANLFSYVESCMYQPEYSDFTMPGP